MAEGGGSEQQAANREQLTTADGGTGETLGAAVGFLSNRRRVR